MGQSRLRRVAVSVSSGTSSLKPSGINRDCRIESTTRTVQGSGDAASEDDCGERSFRVGSALSQAIGDRQWNLRRLVRRSSANDRGDGISWNPESGLLNFTGFSGTDAVVHLAGENIASGRWTAAKKLRIRDSRVIGTHRLCKSLASMPPRVLVCASASQMIRASEWIPSP